VRSCWGSAAESPITQGIGPGCDGFHLEHLSLREERKSCLHCDLGKKTDIKWGCNCWYSAVQSPWSGGMVAVAGMTEEGEWEGSCLYSAVLSEEWQWAGSSWYEERGEVGFQLLGFSGTIRGVAVLSEEWQSGGNSWSDRGGDVGWQLLVHSGTITEERQWKAVATRGRRGSRKAVAGT
jgi:hypothetical protein